MAFRSAIYFQIRSYRIQTTTTTTTAPYVRTYTNNVRGDNVNAAARFSKTILRAHPFRYRYARYATGIIINRPRVSPRTEYAYWPFKHVFRPIVRSFTSFVRFTIVADTYSRTSKFDVRARRQYITFVGNTQQNRRPFSFINTGRNRSILAFESSSLNDNLTARPCKYHFFLNTKRNIFTRVISSSRSEGNARSVFFFVFPFLFFRD